MKKSLIVSLAALLAAVSCTKEFFPESQSQENTGTVTLTAVIEDELTRAYLDSDNYVCWADGDQVWINGNTYTVHVNGTVVTIPGVTSASTYACVYPAGAASSITDGCKVKITLSQAQTITLDNSGRQILNLPMAAYGDGTTTLKFRNLCGLIGVTVSNTDKDGGLTLSNMTLSTLSTFGNVDFIAPLNGETWAPRDLSSDNYAEDWAVLASNIGGKTSTEKRSLNISFPANYTIAKNASTTFYIPVPVIDKGTASNLSVTINASVPDNTNTKTITYYNVTTGTKTIGRNQLGRIPAPSTEFYELKPSGSEWNGSGTQADPYQISNTDQFHRFTKMVRDGEADGKYFRQVCDINFNNASVIPAGITGSRTNKSFSGVYDGGHHALKNFRLVNDDPSQHPYTCVGLFPHIKGGTVKNLIVDSDIYIQKSEFSSDITNISAIAGKVTNGGALSNVTYKGTLSHDYDDITYIGCIAGSIDNSSGTISGLVFDGILIAGSSAKNVGGIAGYCKVANITDCHATSAAEIKMGSSSYVGGLFGSVDYYQTLEHCSFAGKVRMMENLASAPWLQYVGGLFGCVLYSSQSVLSDIQTLSGSSMEVTGFYGHIHGAIMDIGGIAGRLEMASQRDNDIIINRMPIVVTAGKSYAMRTEVGGIAGVLITPASAQMRNDADITVTENYRDIFVGGVCGDMYNISKSVSIKLENNGKVAVKSGWDEAAVGGLIGYLHTGDSMNSEYSDDSVVFYDCLNTGNVSVCNTATDYTCAGGLIGWVNGGAIKRNPSGINFTNKGEIYAEGAQYAFSGGVIGAMAINLNKPIGNFSNEGKVTAKSDGGDAYAGGMMGFDIPVRGESQLSETVGVLEDYTLTLDGFRNTGSVSSTALYNAFSGGVIGYDYDNAGTSNQCVVRVFNAENLGTVEATANIACSGGILGYHDSNGFPNSAPCVINCCNLGGLAAHSAEGQYEYAGGIIGYCYDDWTEVGLCYSCCRMDGYEGRDIKCGGLSGTFCIEQNSYWDIDYGGSLLPLYSWEDGSNKGTKKWTEMENGPSDLSVLVSRLNYGRYSEPYYKDYVTIPSLLSWESRNGHPRLTLSF